MKILVKNLKQRGEPANLVLIARKSIQNAHTIKYWKTFQYWDYLHQQNFTRHSFRRQENYFHVISVIQEKCQKKITPYNIHVYVQFMTQIKQYKKIIISVQFHIIYF